jgi:hypothetical protein
MKNEERRIINGVVLIASILLTLGHSRGVSPTFAQDDETLFVDVSQAAGIINNRRGTDKTIGQAWGDYNNDGWPDLYVTDHAGPNTLYQNNGDGTFSLSPFNSQVILPEKQSSGATFIDYDNDGWADLYVLAWGKNTLFRNLAGDGFERVTAEAGISGGDKNSKTASWGDFNQDGYLDLYVANWACYPMCGRPQYGDNDKLYQNNGDGTFSDMTHLLGGKISGSGFVASFTDYDNDGDLDIYLVNDEFINPVRNALWRNDGPGCDGWCFTELSESAGADMRMMGMGLATADYDNDGDQDFYISNVSHMVLLQNQGDGTFVDMAESAGVATLGSVGWGNVFFDYDNDGWQDIYLAVSNAMGKNAQPRNRLYRNLQDGSFADVSLNSGASGPNRTLGVATADYNRDGWVDLLIGNFAGDYQLFENQSNRTNHWLSVDLVGGGPVNRDGIGTRVFVETAEGLTRMQELISGSGLGAGNELVLHFGLGEHEMITKLMVVWPDGLEQSFDNVPADQRLVLTYPKVDEMMVDEVIVDVPSADGNLQAIGALLGALVTMFLAFGSFWRP